MRTWPPQITITKETLEKRLFQPLGVLGAVVAILSVLSAYAHKQFSELRPGYLKAHAAALKLENLLGNPNFSSTGKQQTTLPDLWNLFRWLLKCL
jgi:hypothetical protein